MICMLTLIISRSVGSPMILGTGAGNAAEISASVRSLKVAILLGLVGGLLFSDRALDVAAIYLG